MFRNINKSAEDISMGLGLGSDRQATMISEDVAKKVKSFININRESLRQKISGNDTVTKALTEKAIAL